MAKKKDGDKSDPKRYGTLIRVSEDFAEKIKDAAALTRTSIADFADAHLSVVVEDTYRKMILKEAKRFERKEGEAK